MNHLGILPSNHSYLLYLPGAHRVFCPFIPFKDFFVWFYSMQSPFYSLTSKEENNIWILRNKIQSIAVPFLGKSPSFSNNVCICNCNGIFFNNWTVRSTVLCLVSQSCPTLCDRMDCSPPVSSVHGDSPGKNIGVDCHAIFQGIFPTQGSNPGLPHCRQILYQPSHQGTPSRVP